ncbi:general transcription factor II-I repeat domain-containing protein 2B-like [Diabrotica virgifera virgifera]|uniref:General transcription factor II-I repeat domain-containing protein 2-like n=1 Tax=Diabrotica virgifera virgifera TaxID=50390 RepID=A0ABM5L1E4_DIAVI|nr:general transcription factor II-I repeat domain-containing protein 2B-like [Diabrotica virgifera virgifera]
MIAEAIAKRSKPLSDGEFVKECLEMFASVACPEQEALVKNISLSHQTIARRIDDMSKDIESSLKTQLKKCVFYSFALDESTDVSDTAQLAVFVRGVTEDYTVIEELLDLRSMKDTTTGKDIYEEVKSCIEKYELRIENLCGLTTDGAPAMTGRTSGFAALMCKNVTHTIIQHHCIIHQEQLCAKVLELKHVMDKVVLTVNFIRAKGLNHRQFQAFLSDVGSDHEDIVYFSSVRWLSRASTLKRFYSLLDEVKIFLENKGQEIDFLTDEQWLADLAFLVDITKYLSDLNLKLQGKDQLCTQLYEHIQAFTKMLILLEKQLEQKQLVHWETLSARNQEMLDLAKYVSLLQRLRNEFEERFVDFKLQIPNMKVFQNPFEIEIDGAVLNLQMELIELQSDSLLKTAYQSCLPNGLIEFYKKYINRNQYPNLTKLALQQISLFGSTYICEQLFSRMKYNKSKTRSSLSDNHLTGILRIATSKIPADIDTLCKQKKCQTSH